MNNQYLTARQVAELCGVTVLTTWRWRRSGTGPPFTRHGSHIRYPADDLVEWLAPRLNVVELPAPALAP